jgi:hypothetical protein
LHQSQQSQWSIALVFIVFIVHKSFFNHVKAEVATDCAKHANVKADVAARKAEVATCCAKHANVKAKVTTGKAETATAYAKHVNVKADVAARKAEVVTDSAGASQMFKFIFKRKGPQLA